MTDTAAPRPESPAPLREIIAWAFYDFANSGYTTVVLTTIYSAYFVGVVAAGLEAEHPGTATLLWTLAIGAANLVVLVSGPVIGAISDVRASKKRFLLVSSVLCISTTALLAGAEPGQVAPALLLLCLSAIAFALGENLIAAFLPEIARSDNMGRISGYGWSLGYFGGLLTLGCCLGYIQYSEASGLGADHYVPVCLLITALIFALTATPTFVWLRERAQPRTLPPGQGYVAAGLGQVASTLQHASRLPDLFRFLICIVLFQAGVSTVVVLAAIYAQEVMNFDSQQLIVLIMLVNLTAALGAFMFGFAQDRFGSVPSLAGALLVWILAIAVALQASTDADVWIAGNLIGLAMGATQAGGRGLVGQLTPPAQNGEIFGLWGLANRAAAILGPISYGVINRLGGGDHQLSLISTLTFFVLGLGLLLTVNERRGHQDAMRYH
ncbi:MFS transporter [Pseudohalioglobus sediminis]|uniref:MFS transporter n=1 Tax=Pseudohalioglobus sediminis TaxID=2606449 RepID=A0A5B0X1F5_9GAMM|nr:MFS transporter [Pseudohalioglobus sediminis]KAA1192478.1 MFS transporter [Pseudohalioglobus sediminis]